jgi:putative membrane protein
MQRRKLLMSGAIAVAGLSVLGRTSFAATDAAGSAEKQHMDNTMRVGSLSLATSQLALEKAHNEYVKMFAEFEVAEQETIADIIKTMQGAGSNATTGQASPPTAIIHDQLDAKGKQVLDKLKSVKAGEDFEREYISAQIDGHQELLKIQETYLKSGTVREEISVAKLARGQIKEHLALLEEAKKAKH